MSKIYASRRRAVPGKPETTPAGNAGREETSPGMMAADVPDQGMGAQLDDRMQTKMDRHFGGESASPEELSGVQVHYNSTLPDKVDAEAYTQGDHIYLAAGQERHLAHELGHVIQQRRGHVPTTERLGGMAANTDPALEHEADVLGAQFADAAPEISGGIGTFGGAPSATDSAAPIQMAGHKGVIQFGNGVIIKRIERNEYEEYKRVQEQQQGTDVSPQVQQRAQAAFPKIYGVFTQQEAEQQGSFQGFDGEKADQLKGWIQGNGRALAEAREKAGGEEPDNSEGYYVQMESMGGSGFSIKDFKMGRFTANSEELIQHGHEKGTRSAKFREFRMRKIDDAKTESGDYGLRDSDEIQKKTSIAKKLLPFKKVHTLAKTRKEVAGGRYKGGGDGGDASQVIKDLEGIEDYFAHSDTVYIGSSIIIKWAKEGGGDRDQARLIDLAHPVRKGEASNEVFMAAKEGMLLGIRNAKNLLLGNQLERGKEQKLPIGAGDLTRKTGNPRDIGGPMAEAIRKIQGHTPDVFPEASGGKAAAGSMSAAAAPEKAKGRRGKPGQQKRDQKKLDKQTDMLAAPEVGEAGGKMFDPVVKQRTLTTLDMMDQDQNDTSFDSTSAWRTADQQTMEMERAHSDTFQAAGDRYRVQQRRQGNARMMPMSGTASGDYLQRNLQGLDQAAQDAKVAAFAGGDQGKMKEYLRQDMLNHDARITGMMEQSHLDSGIGEVAKAYPGMQDAERTGMTMDRFLQDGIFTPGDLGFDDETYAKMKKNRNAFGRLMASYRMRRNAMM